MAVLLMREFQLITLRVSLEGSGQTRGGTVRVQLEGFEHGSHSVEWGPVDFALGEFGLPSRLDVSEAYFGKYELHVPGPLLQTLEQWMGDHNEARTPLWVYLVKPYGYLGLVPWERELVAAAGVPVLRLPDFLEPPLDTRSPLDIGLVCTVPPKVGKAAVRLPQLEEAVRILAGELPRPSHLHLFCGMDTREMARDAFASMGNVTVYDPGREDDQAEDAWFRWIREAMRGTALDTVHFLTHGVISADGGMLALSASPGSDRPGGFYPAAAQVDQFLAAVGAWGAAFHVPADRSTDLGVRYVADSLGMIRPGTVLYHDPQLDDGTGLRGACELMYATDPAPAPQSRATFMYIQPERVLNPGGASDLRANMRNSSRRERWDAQLPSGYQESLSGKTLPGYVQSVERMSEKWAAVLDSNDLSLPPAPLGTANALDVPYLSAEEQSAVDDAIGKLRSVVAEFALDELEGTARFDEDTPAAFEAEMGAEEA